MAKVGERRGRSSTTCTILWRVFSCRPSSTTVAINRRSCRGTPFPSQWIGSSPTHQRANWGTGETAKPDPREAIAAAQLESRLNGALPKNGCIDQVETHLMIRDVVNDERMPHNPKD